MTGKEFIVATFTALWASTVGYSRHIINFPPVFVVSWNLVLHDRRNHSWFDLPSCRQPLSNL